MAIPWLREQVAQWHGLHPTNKFSSILKQSDPAYSSFREQPLGWSFFSNHTEALLGIILPGTGQGSLTEHHHKQERWLYVRVWAWFWSILVYWYRWNWCYFHGSYFCGLCLSYFLGQSHSQILNFSFSWKYLQNGYSLITLQSSLPSAVIRNWGVDCKAWGDSFV